MTRIHRIAPTLSLAATVAALTPFASASPQDWVIPAGVTVEYDTIAGPVVVDRLIIESGGELHVVGGLHFALTATRSVHIAGTLDLSGQDNHGVLTINTTNIPEPGARGGPGGGPGGTGSPHFDQSSPRGGMGRGWDSFNEFLDGGTGGESGYSATGENFRRAAGGGGGAFGPDRPSEMVGSLRGLVASPGFEGGPPPGLGAESQSTTAQGGHAGENVFHDGDPDNDFWGRKRARTGVVRGELRYPRAGSGGGAGGDAVDSDSFPLIPFLPTGDEKGAGGGGGGGFGSIRTHRFVLAEGGQILANGGAGGGGENSQFFNRVGGGSGGGSGGMLVMHARLFDLRGAAANSIQAVGGRGGLGRDNVFDTTGAGGDGGPGLIQLHTIGGSARPILLPQGLELDELTLPDAHVLLPADLSGVH